MQTLDSEGRELSLGLFIQSYLAALKLSPGRFLTLKIHPEAWALIASDSEEVTHVVNIQDMPAPMGKRVLKVACVPAPKALGEGVTVEQNAELPLNRFAFAIHGSEELEVTNFTLGRKLLEG